MKEIHPRVIDRLYRKIAANKRREKTATPIAAVLFSNKGGILYSANNSRTIKKKRDSKLHAEQKITRNYKTDKKGLRLLVSTPPCGECFEEIKKYGSISEIIWLFEKNGKDSVTEDDIINIHQLDEMEYDNYKSLKRNFINFRIRKPWLEDGIE